MPSPARLTELLTEFVFLLLGALAVWLALSHQISFDRHSLRWLILSGALVAWGLLALARRGQFWAKWQRWNRGVSLVLLGLIMFAISRVTFEWMFKLLAVAGMVLIARGLIGSLLILRQR
jgi:hypothetical protein